MKNIINLEVNEIPPKLIEDYISENPNSTLAILAKQGEFELLPTICQDIEKEKLYPSQTWASFNTGMEFSSHKAYWYSDPIDPDILIWNRLARNGISVGVAGSLHSSKVPADLQGNNAYAFYIPDCFGKQESTKPDNYSMFQRLNLLLVDSAARKLSLKGLLAIAVAQIAAMAKSPRSYGISRHSVTALGKIFAKFLTTRNKEVIRVAQFPLLGSIFFDLCRDLQPRYATIFTNHVAGNMHRYWYATRPQDFESSDKYSAAWIRKNSTLIPFSISLLDDYLGYLKAEPFFDDATILITSSMGQEATPGFSSRQLSEYDGKIVDLRVFLSEFEGYCKKITTVKPKAITIDDTSRNMSPQYGFKLNSNLAREEVQGVVDAMVAYLNEMGLSATWSINESSFVLTVDVYRDHSFQAAHTERQARRRLRKFGFEIFAIDDHHSGHHCPEGVLCVISKRRSDIDFFKAKMGPEGRLQNIDFLPAVLEALSIPG